MSNVTLIVIPGPGARTVTLTPGTTVSSFVSSNNLTGRDIIINGTIPLKDNYFKLLTFFVSFDFKWAALFL